MFDDESGRRHTAVHEAGHAVIGRALSVPCGQASVIADNDSTGHSLQADPWAVLYRWELMGRERPFRSALCARALILMAGAEAEIAILGECRGGDGDDRVEAARAIAEADESIGEQHTEARLRRFARQLVTRHRPTIEAVAAKLAEVGSMSKEALDAVCGTIEPEINPIPDWMRDAEECP